MENVLISGAASSLVVQQRRTLNPSEAGKIAGVGHNRIREWVKAGKLRALPGRRILIPEAALEEFLRTAQRREI